jgi:hypothetical protein
MLPPKAKADIVLIKEELDFIAEMGFEAYPELDSGDMRLDLRGDGSSSVLLEGLNLSNKLQIQAYYHNYKFIFPLSIGQNEFGQFHMELKSPEILELGSHIRHWRHKPDQPLIGRSKTENNQFSLDEMSSTGFVLNLPSASAPESLELELTLPDGEVVEIAAQKVRPTTLKKTAYTMTLLDTKGENLRAFLYSQLLLQR